jgi:Subtilase family
LRFRLLTVLATAVVCACSAPPLRPDSRAFASHLSQSQERYIVAAVDNEHAALAGHAGSSPRGYDGVTAYGPSAHAVQLMKSLEAAYGLKEVSAWPIEPLHMHCAVLELPPGADRAAVLDALSRDRRVRLVEPLQLFATRTQVYNDPYVGLQRGFQQMDVADAHPWSRGDGVKIAIVDTGADLSHPDLRGAIAASANFVDADAQQFNRDRHGTEIAGIIAAVANNRQGIVGVAPGARLWIFKACWQLHFDADAAHCNSFTLAQALVAALDAHVQIVNLSIGGPDDPLLRELMLEGMRRGIVFVGADAGAGAGEESLLHHKGVIEVASMEAPASAGAASLRAPGREILTLLPGGHYDFASGSSLATAHVTGAVALLLAKNRRLSADSLFRLLQDSSTGAATAAEAAVSVDACTAVIAVVGHGACNQYVAPDNRLASDADQRLSLH